MKMYELKLINLLMEMGTEFKHVGLILERIIELKLIDNIAKGGKR